MAKILISLIVVVLILFGFMMFKPTGTEVQHTITKTQISKITQDATPTSIASENVPVKEVVKKKAVVKKVKQPKKPKITEKKIVKNPYTQPATTTNPVIEKAETEAGEEVVKEPTPLVLKKYGNFASDENISIKVKGEEAYINGEINTGALAIFKQMLSENPQVTTIVQGDMPGSADDNEMIALAYYVREKGLNTKLLADSAIASGGTDLFIAGVERTMEQGATIGVHSWKDQDGKDAADYPKESSEHDENVDYVNDMLGSEDFYWFTIYAAEADDMHQMTKGEITEYGLLTK
jgi:hypothetical protein